MFQKIDTSKFEKDGFLVIKNILNKNEIKKAQCKIDELLEKNIKKKNNNVHFINKKINSIHNIKNFKLIAYLQKNKNIRKIVLNILGTGAKKFGAELFAKPAKYGREVPVHQDNFYWCTLKGSGITIWIALKNSNKKNGGIFYYKGSHKMGLLEHDISYVPGTSQKLKYLDSMNIFKKIFPSLKTGDCVVHSSLIVHGSKKNLSNLPRQGLTLRYISKNDPIDQFKKKYYNQRLRLSLKGIKNARL